jgi:hypothetical protein
MGKIKLEDADQLISATIYLSQQKNKIPPIFSMTPDSRQYLVDTIQNAIESGKEDSYVTALCVGFIVGYSFGLQDMSEFAEKVLGDPKSRL